MILVGFIKVSLMCTLLLVSSTPSRAREEGSSPPAKCSAAKERMRRALVRDEPHLRTKRTIETPPGTSWQCKWAINLPFETQKRYTAKLQLAIPVHINVPAFLFDDRGLEKLLGFYEEEEEEGGGSGESKKRIDYDGYDSDFDATVLGSHSEYLTPKIIPLPKPKYLEKSPVQGASAYHRRTARSIAYSRAIQSERMELYYRVEGLLNKLGMPGPTCLQRTICELAQDPIEYGLMGDLINLFFTPSLATLNQTITDFGQLEDYVKAERHGEVGGHCGARYGECHVSMFEVLPVVVNSLMSK